MWLLKGGSRKGIVTALILTVEAYRDWCSKSKAHDLSVEGSAKAKKTEFLALQLTQLFLDFPLYPDRILPNPKMSKPVGS